MGPEACLSVCFQETFLSRSGSPVSNLRSSRPLLNDLMLCFYAFCTVHFNIIIEHKPKNATFLN
jgi:hypothetical protein